jgi:hypothetical protein
MTLLVPERMAEPSSIVRSGHTQLCHAQNGARQNQSEAKRR